MTAIALDAMGGDNAPQAEVAGAIAAVDETQVRVLLVGDKDRLRAELKSHGRSECEQIEIRHASEVVSMKDNPGKVFRQKTDSSMRVATDLVVSGEAGALVSAGNSGAMLSHCLFLLKRLPSVERPGIIQEFPTPTGIVTICDLGANTVVSPTMLAQFGILGAHYDRILHSQKRPRVGILSNGSEDSKGTELTRDASELLRQASSHADAEFEFVGYVEGSEILADKVDVLATDGFTGNVVLKTMEGVSEAVMRMIKTAMGSTVRAKLGGLLARPALLAFRDSIHYSKFGGAMLLGINGTATICHGRSNAEAITNAIFKTNRLLEKNLRQELGHAIARHAELWKSVKQ